MKYPYFPTTLQHFHWIVAITTIVLYFYLRWKRTRNHQSPRIKPKSNLVYLLLWPATLYGIYYFFFNKSDGAQHASPLIEPVKPSNRSDNHSDTTALLSSPYPNSDSISV
uniref:Uncharacterized protein n=1 Tax=viral metagenome TaxID=1070528 RepID=A0A6C0H6E9_9ZZZZ